MSDREGDDSKPFEIDRAKSSRAKCKKCKIAIDKNELRIAKIMANPFGDGKMRAWHHISCIFEVFAKQRAKTKRIDNPNEDISGWEDLSQEDQDYMKEKILEFENATPFKGKKNQTNDKANRSTKVSPNKQNITNPPEKLSNQTTPKKLVKNNIKNEDDSFLQFQKICEQLAKHPSYLDKTAIVKTFFTKGSKDNNFEGNKLLWCKLLLPGAVKRIYNLQSKALIKLFSRIFRQSEEEMLEDLEKGDVAETIKTFYDKSSIMKPQIKSTLTIQEIDIFLDELTKLTKEDEQIMHLKSIVTKCTPADLRTIIRLIKHDLRINAGPKHILGAIHKEAYEAFQLSQDLPTVIHRFLNLNNKMEKKKSNVALSLMTPVLPMLAEPCKSVEMAFKKCPHGMLSEIKYDGERIQIHKKCHEFKYFSRSLKPVLPHKVNFIKEYLPKALPKGDSLILDAEILLIDTTNGQPLPFGSLGKHKKDEFQDANVCLFIFDIIYYNDEVLLDYTMKERRKILEDNIIQIPNRIMLSEIKQINKESELRIMIANAFKLKLEGLVLKNVDSKYEPGKRHWLKVKKDYLCKGAMADSADLVVLGAWYGTGQKGGMMSIFLMGCYDPSRDKWLTVTKVHGGHDDTTLADLQNTLDMKKISKDPNMVPNWLIVNKPMIPDFIAKDPKKQPVWEITGAEFTNQGCHTADGISIRFPRVTRIRDDKDWKTATNIIELRNLFSKSAESVDYASILDAATSDTSKNQNKKINNQVSDTESLSSSSSSSSSSSPTKSKFKSPNKSKKLQGEKFQTNSNTDKIHLASDRESKPNKKSNRNDISLKSKKRKKSNELEENCEMFTKKNKHEQEKIKEECKESGNFSDLAKEIENDEDISMEIIDNHGNIDSMGLPFGRVKIYFDEQLNLQAKSKVEKTLKEHGASILTADKGHEAEYVIHESKEISAIWLKKNIRISKLARHVHSSWIHDSLNFKQLQDPEPYAVILKGSYCQCPCYH